MSATTENATTAVVNQPTVAEHTAKVEASEAFQDAHTGEGKDSTVTEPTAILEAKPAETTASAISEPKEEPSKEQKISKKETQITATPITSGNLGYKAPGLMSQLRYKQHYFWLGDAAVPITDLTQYLRGEKPDTAHPTAAWSSQTGKGLLYFSKSEDSKKSPGGILNLADATNVAKEGDKIFSFRLARHKHSFEAKNSDERNGWVVAIESAHEEAAKNKDEITNNSGYKESLSSLGTGKPGVGAAAGTPGVAAAGGTGASAATHASEERKEEKAEKKEERRKSDDSDPKKNTKSRSRSNKRTSVIGSIMGRKDDKKEEKKEEKAEKQEEKKEKKEEKAAVAAIKKEEKEEKQLEKAAASEAKKEEKEEKKEEKKAEKEEKKAEKEEKKEEKKHEGEAAAGVAGVGGTGVATTEHKKSEKAEDKNKAGTERSKSKRRSILGIFDKSNKSPSTEKKESEVGPAAGSGVGGINNETNKAEHKTVEAFKDDPVSAEEPAKDAKKETGAGTAISEAKAEGGKSKEGSSPTSKRSSILDTVFRRPSKQTKSSTEEAKKDKKEASTTPATVPEATLEGETAVTDPVNKTEGTAAGSKDITGEGQKTGEPAIGDVVPEAVTVGEGEVPKPVSTTA